VLGYLRDAGVKRRVLHVAPYTEDIGLWALHNELCTDLWVAGQPAPAGLTHAAGLSLFHSPLTVKDFRSLKLSQTLGPRSKLSALWSYRKSIAQHRSQVRKSELEYNLDLARALLNWQGRTCPQFQGVPALKVPAEWSLATEAPDLILVVCNGGSARNWPMSEYLRVAREALGQKRRVDFLVGGDEAEERKAALQSSGILKEAGVSLVENFPRLHNLIAYLASAREVLASSTGPLHIAHAAGVKVTGIYPTERVQSFERWRPDGYWHTAPTHLIEI